MSSQGTTAPFSCDYCRDKKLRCTRELPKCSNCKPWPSTCVYSRQMTQQASKKLRHRNSMIAEKETPKPQLEQMEDRLSGIENSICRLTSAIESLAICISANARTSQGQSPNAVTDGGHDSSRTVPAAYVISMVSQVTEHLNMARAEFEDVRESIDAKESLADLSREFTASQFEGYDVRAELRLMRREDLFHIPEEKEGLRLLKIFVQRIRVGTLFFEMPSDELLLQAMFSPAEVEERALVLLLNSFLSAMITLEEPGNVELSRRLQWNTWLALDNASIFLEPSIINIQALMMLATHSQEIAPPSLCWTLISHACRMAQALALHKPTVKAPEGSKEYYQQNNLFWNLFILDKSLSLCFGRPPFLESSLYVDVPLPDQTQLRKFQPHRRLQTEISSEEANDEFGSFFFQQHLRLSKIMGSTTSLLQGYFEFKKSNYDAVKADLVSWHQRTLDKAPDFIDDFSSMEIVENKESIRLGINFLKFQYHHMMVCLMRTDKNPENVSLASARECLSMLNTLVSNAKEIYNGIVWQLLYYPFSPFFVVFGTILSHPRSKECAQDLQLLRHTISYYHQMRNNHKSAIKIEKIAETFTRLAEEYVHRKLSTPEEAGKSRKKRKEVDFAAARLPADNQFRHTEMQNPGTGSHNPITPHTSADLGLGPSSSTPSSQDLSPSTSPPTFNFNDLNTLLPDQSVDLLTFFGPQNVGGLMDWNFGGDGADGVPMPAYNDPGMVTMDETNFEEMAAAGGEEEGLFGSARPGLVGGVAAEKRLLDYTFDWLSWDREQRHDW